METVTITKDRYLSLLDTEHIVLTLYEKAADPSNLTNRHLDAAINMYRDDFLIAYDCDGQGDNIQFCKRSDLE